MSIPVLVIGQSGAGKSTSLRTLDPGNTALISVLGKPLPFRSKLKQLVTDNYQEIIAALKLCTKDVIVIDDVGYLMTNQFMRGHASAGGGNGVFSLYNQIGDNFWQLVELCRRLPGDKRIYFIMHEDISETTGKVKPKSIGKIIDEKVCLEGMFTICLHAMLTDGKHIFRTQSDGNDTAKSPIDMFESEEIPNDLALVDQKICEYYEINNNKEN